MFVSTLKGVEDFTVEFASEVDFVIDVLECSVMYGCSLIGKGGLVHHRRVK